MIPGDWFQRCRRLWRDIPLARQIFLAMSCSMWAATSLYFAYDIYATNRRLLAMERSTLGALFPVLQGMIDESMVRGERSHVRDLFLNAGRNSQSERLMLLDAEKNEVDVHDLGAGLRPRHRPPPAFKTSDYLVMDFPLRAQASCLRCHSAARGDVLGFVRIAAEHQERLKAVRAHVLGHLGVLAMTMAMMGVWTLGIVRLLIQAPLARIVAAIQLVGEGRLDTRVEDLPPGELRQIGTGFNAMVRKLERDRRQILDLHRRQVAHIERLVAVGEVAAQLAHEVRNPLTGISSALQILQQETPEENPRRRILGKILAQFNRMDQTMANFLSFARMPEAVVRPFDLREPLGRVAFLLEPRLRSQGIELRQQSDAGLPPLIGDPGQMEQVFLNLALNATQAMPSGGTLTVAARPDPEGGVLVEFSDTGHGIPSDKLDHVFKPFFTTREKGSGLGLSVAKQIVMAHEGEIWIESVPERGTSVFLHLPAAGAALEQGVLL